MRKRHKLLLVFVALSALTWVVGRAVDLPWLADLALAGVAVLLFIWGVNAFFRVFLWRVGRKLAFSYFLIGVLPVPLVLLLFGVVGYVIAGMLVGHLFRDSVETLQQEMVAESKVRLLDFATGQDPIETSDDLAFAYYRGGVRVAGDARAPESWPDRLGEIDTEGSPVRFLALDDDQGPAFCVSVSAGDTGIVTIFHGDFGQAIADRSGIWVEIRTMDSEEDDRGRVEVQLGGKSVVLSNTSRELTSADRIEYFGGTPGEKPFIDVAWLDRPVLYWIEPLGTMTTAESPEVGIRLATILNTTLADVQSRVVSSSTEADAVAWGALLAVAFLLFDIYAVAVVMAAFLIYGLSRAVNQLSRATGAVRDGDFSVRIKVKRRDQLGELQRGFNRMAANLEELIASAAEKESLEKELAIARELQQNLLPSTLTTTEAVEFASYFEPSAAIGGDYFDLLKLEQGRLVVVVADVSGHGLSAGLRMAMLKAALVMLVEQRLPPSEVFRRLSDMVKRDATPGMGRPMATATLAIFDPATGRLELTNAGHTPTYRVHDGEVDEIELPSPPLGLLGDDYATETIALRPGDLVVWMSDGLIEATNEANEPFGFERVRESLRGHPASASHLRDWLLQAVASHCGPNPPADDRTLVVMRYLPSVSIREASPTESPAEDETEEAEEAE